jgi:hypothetical protein
VSALLQDIGPFTGFKGDPVGACKSCRYKSDILVHSNKTRLSMFQKVKMNNLMADSASTGSLPPIIKRTDIESNYHFTGNNRVADFLKIF